ncbi:MAG TPA: glycosyltransferase [Alicycliphilus sp.]|nr:glycosyltransferase [Alicycliphilus sp.]
MTTEQRPRHLLHAFSTFQMGGPQARFVELANALGPMFRHTIVAMDNRFDAGERLHDAVNWTPMPLTVVKGGALANRGAFRQVLRSLRPDLLVSYNWGAIEWAAGNFPRVCPQVHVEDGFGPEEAERQLPRRVWMRRALLGWTGMPVVVISRQLERIALQVWKLPASRVRFIANGVSVPVQQRPQRDLSPEGVIHVGTVAGLRPEKNIARLIKAFAGLRATRAARLTIVGGGPLQAELQQLALALGVADDVEFAGYLSNPALKLKDFDLFALSSDTEQLPIALLEAMAVGMPVAATAVGDVPAILAEVSPGNVCAPDDEAFTRLLLQVAQASSQWPEWRSRGHALVSRCYAKPAMLAQWQAVWAGQSFHGAASLSHA